MRILWVKTGPLLPLDTGGKRRTHAMLTEISKAHEVVYLSLLPKGAHLHPKEASDPYAAEKIWIESSLPDKSSPLFWLDLALSTLASSRPYALHKYACDALHQKLSAFAESDLFDLVICDFLAPALNFEGLRFKCPTILFQHNIEAQIWQRLATSQRSVLKKAYLNLQYQRMKKWEQRLSNLFDGVITVSPEDTQIARTSYALPNVLGHVPTGVDVDLFRPAAGHRQERPFTMGFLGSMDWMPNIDASLYFIEEILPLVRQQVPHCRFKIIGRNPPQRLRDLAAVDTQIEVTGTVDDVQPHVHDCDVIVIPLKAGGGTRIKIYEAMAMGVTVVSTTIGAEGLAVTHGADTWIADTTEDFAASLVRMACDEDLRNRLATQAREQVVSHHSWQSATRCFMDLCHQCIANTQR